MNQWERIQGGYRSRKVTVLIDLPGTSKQIADNFRDLLFEVLTSNEQLQLVDVQTLMKKPKKESIEGFLGYKMGVKDKRHPREIERILAGKRLPKKTKRK